MPGMKLDERSLDLIRTVLDLEEQLASHADPLQPLEPWGVAQHLQPVLYSWAAGQLGLLQSWTQRLMAAEEWRPVTQPRSCSRSARLLTPLTHPALLFYGSCGYVHSGIACCAKQGICKISAVSWSASYSGMHAPLGNSACGRKDQALGADNAWKTCQQCPIGCRMSCVKCY